MLEKIDFVIPWVDGDDPNWQKEKAKYSLNPGQDSREIRFRDTGWLKYWFRGIEKNAPWVNKVHFITCGHVPEWLNLKCPKLHFVKHSDYIPKEYLPTFSSHPIELNMHRIEGLSEKFVYFNDDVFLINPVKETDFFKHNKPCDCLIGSAITPRNGEFSSILCATVSVINDNFTKKDIMSQGVLKWLSPKYKKLLIRTLSVMPYHHIMGFYNPHICVPFCKSTFETVWQKEFEVLDRTCKNRYRDMNDVSQYLMRYWNLCEGKYVPTYPIGKNIKSDVDYEKIASLILKSNVKCLCINDTASASSQETIQQNVSKIFEDKFPDKCDYELA